MFRKRPPAVSSSPEQSGNPVTPQRRYVRAAVDLPVDYALEGRAGRRGGRVDDLGGGGVRLETDEDLVAGTVLDLEFGVGDVAVSARGRVVMSFFEGGRKRFLHGIAFTSIDPAQQEAIVRRVTELQHGAN